MVDVDDSNLCVDSWPKTVGLLWEWVASLVLFYLHHVNHMNCFLCQDSTIY